MEKILTGATILWGEDLEEKADHALYVKDGRIVALLHVSHIPSDKHVVQLEGGFLLPGLIDLHVHIMWDGSADPVETQNKESYEQKVIRSIANAQKHLQHGVTTIRDLGSVDDIALHVAEAINRKIIVGPRIVACGKTLAMTGGHDPFWARFCDGPDEARKGVREQIYKNAQVIKVSATGGVYGREEGEVAEHAELTYEELKAVCDEAHRFGRKVASHAIGREGIYHSIRAGVDSIEHGHYLDDELVELMKEKNVAWVPTLFVYQQIAQLDGIPQYARAKAEKIVARHEQAFRSYFYSGVLIGAGSDAGSCLTPHPSVVEELQTMRKYVANVRDILKTATSNAGKILGRNVGQLAEGYQADFVLLGANPLENLQSLQDVREVYINGERVYRRCAG